MCVEAVQGSGFRVEVGSPQPEILAHKPLSKPKRPNLKNENGTLQKTEMGRPFVKTAVVF